MMKTTLNVRMMSREAFIAEHVAACEAQPCRKYDAAKPERGGLHSLAYSRRKCAKSLWRRLAATAKARP